MRMKLGAKIALMLLVVAAVGWGGHEAMERGYFNPKQSIVSSVPKRVELPNPTPPVSPASPAAAPAPTPRPAPPPAMIPSVPAVDPTGSRRPAVKLTTIAWNGVSGVHYANGDATTVSGSLMAKHGLNLTLVRQDDYSQMIAEMAAFSKAFAAGNANPKEGTHFVIIMGDAYPAFIRGVNEALAKYGHAGEAVGIVGFSRGEDACMLPPEMRTDPQKARGSLIGGVPRDGDLHICFKWAGDNGIPINADEKTYDPDAINIVATSTFIEADEKLIAGYCEMRPVVKNGRKTGETRRVCQNGTATWTPGDVKVAMAKGGVIRVASTAEYKYQMAALVIGNKQWMAANPSIVQSFLAAAFEGSDAVAQNDTNLLKATTIAAKVYNEETGEWWARYFKGVVEKDKTGMEVPLGGSAVSGLADNVFYFGLNDNDDLFRRVYKVYSELDMFYYPADLPDVPAYDTVVNKSYLEAVLRRAEAAKPVIISKPTYSQTAPVVNVMARRSWNIEFETAKSTFFGNAPNVLDDLLNQVAVTDLAIQITGHTDNVGNPTANLELSRKRAEAVKAWLIANAPSGFPPDRIRIRGFGDSQPIADNKTNEGRAKNRRVDITLLVTQ